MALTYLRNSLQTKLHISIDVDLIFTCIHLFLYLVTHEIAVSHGLGLCRPGKPPIPLQDGWISQELSSGPSCLHEGDEVPRLYSGSSSRWSDCLGD